MSTRRWALALLALGVAGQAQAPQGTLTVLRGEVQLNGAPVHSGLPLPADFVLNVAVDAEACLELGAQGTFRVSPSSRVMRDTRGLLLERGSLLGRGPALTGLRTPYCEIMANRPAEVLLESGPARSRIRLLEGSATASGPVLWGQASLPIEGPSLVLGAGGVALAGGVSPAFARTAGKAERVGPAYARTAGKSEELSPSLIAQAAGQVDDQLPAWDRISGSEGVGGAYSGPSLGLNPLLLLSALPSQVTSVVTQTDPVQAPISP